MNDLPQPRTVQDLERKYDLNSLVKAKKEVEKQKQTLNQLQRTLYGTIESLIANLKDVIGTQDKVSLLFYDELVENKYILAENGDNIITEDSEILVDDYICLNEGDILYIRTTAKAYQYKNGELLENTDINLIQALALTNVEVGEGKERKIYLTTPSPPYSSGDWYLTSEGVLYICQLGKTETEQYEENDFILANKYTTTVAIKDGNRTTVLEGSVKILDESIKEIEGTIVEIRKNFVKFTDLLTGGSTTIAGENITTGNIQSGNYVENVSGSKLSLANGEFDSPNVKIKQDGLYLKNGTNVINDKGIQTTFNFGDGRENLIGYVTDTMFSKNEYYYKNIYIYIPENYTISEAYLVLEHTPIKWINKSTTIWGYSRNVSIYKKDKINTNKQYEILPSEDYNAQEIFSKEIQGFGNNGFTAQNPSTEIKVEKVISSNIAQYISNQTLALQIRSRNSTPAYNPDIMENGIPQAQTNCLQQTGEIRVSLFIIGFKK